MKTRETRKIIRNTRFGWMLIIGLMIFGTLFSPTDVAAKAKSKAKVKTITITKVNQKTAKTVHSQLMSGKKFKLRVKGNIKTFHKKVEKLMDKVAQRTEYRFDFYPIILGEVSVSTAKGYTYCTISSQDCSEYIYGFKFAERRHKLFIDYVDKSIPELEDIRNKVANNDQTTQIQLTSGASPKETASGETIPGENIPMRLDELITSTQELSKYLHKTKFYKLSDAMKARIMLPISSDMWCKPAMRYVSNSSRITFKALYQSKAYGRCSSFALVTCKICAVFGIGDCDYFSNVAAKHAVARTKVKTLNGKTKYSVISNGNLSGYNDYVGYKPYDYDGYRRPHKVDKKIKKINTATQELKIPYVKLKMRTIPPEPGAKKMISMHCIDIPKSEW